MADIFREKSPPIRLYMLNKCTQLGQSFSNSRTSGFALAALIFLGLFLRSYRLTERSVWFDEAFTWRLIKFPFVEMLQRSQHDNSPPLYYILLQAWSAIFGESAFALRSFSVLCGELTIVGTFLFAKEAFEKDLLTGDTNSELHSRGSAIGLLSAAFVSVSALQVRYSWEIRMYALGSVLTVFSSWILFRALYPPSRLRRWLLYGFLALLLTYTHYYGLFALAAQAIFAYSILLVRGNWRLFSFFRTPDSWHAFLAFFLVIASWLPWLPTFLYQRAQVKVSFWSHPITRWDAVELCYRMFVMPESFPPPPRSLELLTADFCLIGFWLLRRRARAAEWFVIGSAFAPFLLSFAFSAPATLRYFAMSQIFLLIGLAVLIWRLPAGMERIYAITASLILFTGFYCHFWGALDVTNKPGAYGAAEFLRQRRYTSEPVIVCFPFFYFPLLHYATDGTAYYLYTDGRSMPHHYGTAILTGDELITERQLRKLRSRRVWVVNMAGGQWGTHTVPTPPNWKAKSRHVFTDVVRLGDVIIVEYENNSVLETET